MEPIRFNNANDIRTAFNTKGDHWFSPNTMRFWKTRLLQTVYGGRVFVTSDERGDGSRGYSVRMVERNESGKLSIRTVGGVTAFSKPVAVRVARFVARMVELWPDGQAPDSFTYEQGKMLDVAAYAEAAR